MLDTFETSIVSKEGLKEPSSALPKRINMVVFTSTATIQRLDMGSFPFRLSLTSMRKSRTTQVRGNVQVLFGPCIGC